MMLELETVSFIRIDFHVYDFHLFGAFVMLLFTTLNVSDTCITKRTFNLIGTRRS